MYCPFQEDKTACMDYIVHCYKKIMKEKVIVNKSAQGTFKSDEKPASG